MFEIGSSLREARMRQGLDFEEMEERTKVRKKYLRHLEDERFDQLPGHTYTKGFLHVYADSLGLDGRLYVEEYNSRYVAGDEDSAAAPRLPRHPVRQRGRRERRESRGAGVALAAILVVTALVIAAWRFGGHEAPKVEGVNANPAAASATKRVTVSVRRSWSSGPALPRGSRCTPGRSSAGSSSASRRSRCTSRSHGRATSP